MAYTILASSSQGSLVNVSFWDVILAIWEVIVHKGNLSVLAQYANPVIKRAEEGQPEGAKMELEVRGLAISGVDYASRIANWLNTKWREGYFREQSGAWLRPWPEYPNRIAWGSGGKLIIRWVKLFPWAAVIVVIMVVALIIIYPVVRPWINRFQWWLKRQIPQPPPSEECKGKTGIARWWCELTPVERAAIIGAVTVVACFGLWYVVEKSLAEAGAPKIIVTPGGVAT